MDNTSLTIYIHELQNHVRHVQAGFEILNRGLQAGVPGEVLYGGQMLLFPASQLSALLWPTRARARGRGEQLRKVLGLPDKHPLNDRRLSELWERGDEKFEEWINHTKNKRIVFDLVGDPFHLTEEEQDDKDKVSEDAIFRCYDPEQKIFYYRGTPYNIPGLGKALQDVANRVLSVYFQMFPEAAKIEQEKLRQQAEQQQQRAAAQDAQAAQAAAESAPEASGEAPTETAAAEEEKPKKPRRRRAPAKKAAEAAEGDAAAAEAAPKPRKRAPRKKKADTETPAEE